MEEKKLTPYQAKKMLRGHLERTGQPFTKLTARTIGFVDLARGSCIFVRVHGWLPSPTASDVKRFAIEHGFRAEFDTGIN